MRFATPGYAIDLDLLEIQGPTGHVAVEPQVFAVIAMLLRNRQPGMCVLGMPFTRRRKSSFLDGVGPDAEELTQHLAGFLRGKPASTALTPSML